MTIDINVIRGLITLVLLVLFIFFILKVYSPKQKKRFEEAGRLIFEDNGGKDTE